MRPLDLLDLLDVALFVRACGTRNLSAAGRDFDLSPAAASTRLAQLERQLGTRLFHRTTRQLTLTQDGEQFFERAQVLLEAAEQATSAVGSASATPQGLLRVAASVSFGRQHIVPALADFLAAYPGIRLDLRLSDHVIDMAAHGIDVAVRIGPLQDAAVVAQRLAPSRLVLVAAPAYLAARGAPATPAALAGHDCLVLGSANTWPLRHPDGRVEAVRVRGRLQSDNGEVCRDAAVAGLGIALQAMWMVYEHLRAGTLVQVLPDYPVAIDAHVSALYLHRAFVPPRARAFIAFCAQRFGGAVPYWESPQG
jgi:DNA-binding transcriptional LysR family regulator